MTLEEELANLRADVAVLTGQRDAARKEAARLEEQRNRAWQDAFATAWGEPPTTEKEVRRLRETLERVGELADKRCSRFAPIHGAGAPCTYEQIAEIAAKALQGES